MRYKVVNRKPKRNFNLYLLSIFNLLALIAVVLVLLYSNLIGGNRIVGAGKETPRYEIPVNATAQGVVAKVGFKDGDEVKAGDTLFEILDIASAEKLEEIKRQMDALKSVQSKGNSGLSRKDINAPFEGYISNIRVSSGQPLQAGDPLFVLTDTSRLKLTLNFSSSDAGQIKVGQKVRVCVWDFMTYVEGEVAYVNSKPISIAGGALVYPVEIQLQNPGGVVEGMDGSAEIALPSGNAASLGGGKYNYVNVRTIRSEYAGTAGDVLLRENQFVNKGENLLKVAVQQADSPVYSNQGKISELQRQLEELQKQQVPLKVLAPASGIITGQAVLPGAGVAAGAELARIQVY